MHTHCVYLPQISLDKCSEMGTQYDLLPQYSTFKSAVGIRKKLLWFLACLKCCMICMRVYGVSSIRRWIVLCLIKILYDFARKLESC